MAKDHTLRIMTPTLDNTNEVHIYLDGERVGSSFVEMHIHFKAGEPVSISGTIIPCGLDALLAFGEANPLALEVYWPNCPHCGKRYDEPVEEKPPFEWGEDHWRANKRFEEDTSSKPIVSPSNTV